MGGKESFHLFLDAVSAVEGMCTVHCSCYSNAGRNDPHHGNYEEGTWGRGRSLVDCSGSQQCRRALHSSQELRGGYAGDRNQFLS
jgi:hypothetical protein